jgi:predicted transcriptional regulator
MQIDKHEYLELKILNCVEKTPRLTTRLIAARVGCNIRLTHALLKKLISKGTLDVKKINSRNWHYYLTPSGISEKAEKTCKFFNFSMHYYQEARERSSEICSILQSEGKKEIAFFGCGNLAEIVYLSLIENNLQLSEVYGDSKKIFMGCEVQPWKNVVEFTSDALIVSLMDIRSPMLEFVDNLKYKNHKRIISVF